MKIAVINTGGTISCVGEPLAPMTAREFAAACQAIVDPVIAEQFPDLSITYVTDLVFPESRSGTLDSTNLQPTDWCRMAGYILAHYADYDGWVVLHGTDSMDFTGAALPFLLSCFDANGIGTAVLSRPVILTGSQLPMFYQAPGTSALKLNFNTDAFQNFCGAVAAAQSGLSEVCVFFESRLFRGCRVRKTNASEFSAFSSPNYPELGRTGITFTLDAGHLLPPPVGSGVNLDNPQVRAMAVAQLDAIARTIDSVPVMQLSAFPAWYTGPTAFLARLITACAGQGARGLILQSYGEGNFPSGNPDNPSQGAIYQALDAANQAGIVIVDNTQVLRAVVNNSAYASGAWLPAVGALNPADMTATAALAKLMVLLAAASSQAWTVADVKRLMQLSLVGEMLNVSRLDSRANAKLLTGQSLSAIDGSATLRNDPARGPVLADSTGRIVWTALPNPGPGTCPGRLIMQNDGNLVFYNSDSLAMWATDTADGRGAPSMLILAGSAADGTLSLYVYNYLSRVVSRVLFGQVPTEAQRA